jgi:hypothetical protein
MQTNAELRSAFIHASRPPEAASRPAEVAAGAASPSAIASPSAEATSPLHGISPAGAALRDACKASDYGLVVRLLEEGADLGELDEYGATVLHDACTMEEDIRIISVLIEKFKDLDLDIAGPNGITALHVASGLGLSAYVALLIEAGADPDTLDRDGKTALYYACRHGDSKIIQLLLEKGADPIAGSGGHVGSRSSSGSYPDSDLVVVTFLAKENRCAACGKPCSCITHHIQTSKQLARPSSRSPLHRQQHHHLCLLCRQSSFAGLFEVPDHQVLCTRLPAGRLEDSAQSHLCRC